MNSFCKISIVMPVFNSESFLYKSIYSVINQSFKEWELIIVDDGSTDNSLNIAQSLSSIDSRLKIIKNSSNRGVVFSRNVALDACTSDFIAFLDSDDLWHVDKLKIQYEYMLTNKLDISYCSYFRFDQFGNVLGVVHPPKQISYRDMLFVNHIPMLTGMFKKSSFEEVKFLDVRHEDYVFWTSLMNNNIKAGLVESYFPLASYLVRPSSLSGNKLKAAIWHWKNLRDDFNLHLVEASYFFVCYSLIQIKKKFMEVFKFGR